MEPQEAIERLTDLIYNTKSGQVSEEQAKKEVARTSEMVQDDNDWNHITGQIEHILGVNPPPEFRHCYKAQKHHLWQRIEDKPRAGRCAEMRCKARESLSWKLGSDGRLRQAASGRKRFPVLQ